MKWEHFRINVPLWVYFTSYPVQRSVIWSFEVFNDVSQNKMLNKTNELSVIWDAITLKRCPCKKGFYAKSLEVPRNLLHTKFVPWFIQADYPFGVLLCFVRGRFHTQRSWLRHGWALVVQIPKGKLPIRAVVSLKSQLKRRQIKQV